MPNVLLVDDNVTFARFMRVLLESKLSGVKVTTAHSMDEARRLASTPFDLAILDVRLPDGDGLQLAEELAQGCRGLRIIMISAEPLRAGAAAERKIEGVLVKPFPSEEAVRLVRRVLPSEPASSPGEDPSQAANGLDLHLECPGSEMKDDLVRLLAGLYEIRQALRDESLSEVDVHDIVDRRLVPLIHVVSSLSRSVRGGNGGKL